MKPINILAVVCFAAIVFAACSKKESSQPTSTAQKLMAGIWQISASTTTYSYMGNDTVVDHYSRWRPCEQDDFTVFGDNSEGTNSENTNKCDEDEQLTYFKWQLLDNDTRIKITLKEGHRFRSNNSQTMTSDLVEVTDTQLKMRITKNTDSTTAVTIETFKNIK